jgi:hypothetical protein
MTVGTVPTPRQLGGVPTGVSHAVIVPAAAASSISRSTLRPEKTGHGRRVMDAPVDGYACAGIYGGKAIFQGQRRHLSTDIKRKAFIIAAQQHCRPVAAAPGPSGAAAQTAEAASSGAVSFRDARRPQGRQKKRAPRARPSYAIARPGRSPGRCSGYPGLISTMPR